VAIANRRDFLRTSAALGVLGASDAQAQSPSQTPTWIILLQSTLIEPDLEEAFLAGLRSRGWEGDLTRPPGRNKPVNIRQVHGLGKYGAGHPTSLLTAAQALQDQMPSKKLIVAVGGNVSAVAVNNVSFSTDFDTKVLALYGGANDVEQNVRARGINLGLPLPPDHSVPPLQKIVTNLHNPRQYNLPFSQLCLLYNGNSQIQQLREWDALTNRMGRSYDASLTHASGENGRMQFATAIDNALDRTDDTTDRALVVTSDPFFTIRRAKIIRRLKRKKNVIACFPFQEYVSDALEADFTRDNCMAWGPVLSDVYETLGQTAGELLNGNFNQIPRVTGVKFVYFGKPE
jgi:hypothetical protein